MNKRLNLGRFIRKGRNEGSVMPSFGAYVPGAVAPASHDAEHILDMIDTHLTDDAPLMMREWVTIAIGDVLKSIRKKPEVLGPRCSTILERLRKMDAHEFSVLQTELQQRRYGPDDFRRDLAEHGTDEADPWTRRLLGVREEPDPEKIRESEMVHYKASPVAAALDLADMLSADDVLYDLGSGLGVVPLLCAWLSPARTFGVEMEPAYCAKARERIIALAIERTDVIESDARTVDYSDGTVFYFYDPFRGAILADVLDRLKAVADTRPITLCALGRTIDTFDATPWLQRNRVLGSGVVVYVSR